MMRKLEVGAILFLLSASPSFAQCDNLPADAQAYLKAHLGWSIVQLKDLDADDQAAWNKHYPGKCPGMADVDLDGRGAKPALALFRQQNEKAFEQVVIFSSDGSVRTLVPAEIVSRPYVIWRNEPGAYEDFNSGKKTRMAHDSLGYEAIGATVELYYFSKGKFHSLLNSD